MEFSFSLVIVCLLLPASGEDVFDRMVPGLMERFEEMHEILLPIPDQILKETILKAGSFYIPLDSETELCRNHSSFMFESFLNKDQWALRMVDASSKLPSGLLDGNLWDLGSYDQCISVEAPDGLFRGQHCLVETKGLLPGIINPLKSEVLSEQYPRLDLMFSVCVPSSCTARDVATHIDASLNSVNASAIMFDDSCSSALPRPLDTSDWAAISILAIVTIILVLSTVYDYRCIISEKNQVLTAFSLSTNLSRMLDTHSPPATLPCLNGLRVLAITWIIIGHRFMEMLGSPNLRFKTVVEKLPTFSLAPLMNHPLSVEIFFVMSGLLVTYNYLRCRLKTKTFNLTYFYLHRYFRLTPALAMIVLLHATLVIRMNDGPLWRRVFLPMQGLCQQYWWENLLYIQNYFNPYHMCVNHSWFLASDFQLHLFSPVLLIPLYRRPWLGLTLTALFFMLTTAGGLFNAYYYELKAGGAFTMDRRTEEAAYKDYIVTHVRAASFLMGVALGYVVFRIKQGQLVVKLSKVMVWTGWLVSTIFILSSVLLVTVFEQTDYVYNPWVDTLYLVLHRHVFSLGVVWIILACTLGYGGVLDSFLSWPVWTPFARLTFGTYLVHLLIQSIQTFHLRSPITIDWFNLWYYFFSDFTMSYLAAAVLYLTVEAPCCNIASRLFKEAKQSKASKSEHVV